jgi:RNA polymerase sigma-70 factor (ECF subfamily)
LTPTNILDERTLFDQIAQGDESAFETIFHRYTTKLKPFVLGFVKIDAVADEIVQDVFLKVWLNKKNLAQVKEPNAWLYRLASNAALNQLKKQAVEYRNLKEIMANSKPNANETFEKLTAKQLQELIHEAVQQLPERRKEIYLLTREQGLSHKEISEKLNIAPYTIKNQVMAAMKQIQEYILKNSGVYIPLILLSVKINLVTA